MVKCEETEERHVARNDKEVICIESLLRHQWQVQSRPDLTKFEELADQLVQLRLDQSTEYELARRTEQQLKTNIYKHILKGTP